MADTQQLLRTMRNVHLACFFISLSFSLLLLPNFRLWPSELAIIWMVFFLTLYLLDKFQISLRMNWSALKITLGVGDRDTSLSTLKYQSTNDTTTPTHGRKKLTRHHSHQDLGKVRNNQLPGEEKKQHQLPESDQKQLQPTLSRSHSFSTIHSNETYEPTRCGRSQSWEPRPQSGIVHKRVQQFSGLVGKLDTLKSRYENTNSNDGSSNSTDSTFSTPPAYGVLRKEIHHVGIVENEHQHQESDLLQVVQLQQLQQQVRSTLDSRSLSTVTVRKLTLPLITYEWVVETIFHITGINGRGFTQRVLQPMSATYLGLHIGQNKSQYEHTADHEDC